MSGGRGKVGKCQENVNYKSFVLKPKYEYLISHINSEAKIWNKPVLHLVGGARRSKGPRALPENKWFATFCCPSKRFDTQLCLLVNLSAAI